MNGSSFSPPHPILTTHRHLISFPHTLDLFSIIVPIQYTFISNLYHVPRRISLLTATYWSPLISLQWLPSLLLPATASYSTCICSPDPSIGKSVRVPFESCLVLNETGHR